MAGYITKALFRCRLLWYILLELKAGRSRSEIKEEVMKLIDEICEEK